MTPIELAEIKRIAEFLREACGDDELAYVSMLEGETNAFEALELTHRSIQADEELLEGIAKRQQELAARKSRIESRRDAKRKAMGQILRAAGLKRAELVEATVSVRDGKAKLVVNDPEAVPEEYTRVKREVDKASVNAAFADAESIPNWLSRSDPQDVISIRSK